jgi:hypothetical protein
MPAMTSQFRTEYDLGTGKASKVVLGLYQLTLIDSLHLLVKYGSGQVYLLRETNPADTVVIASFDADDRLISIAQGNSPEDQLGGVQFNYSGGSLSDMSFDFGFHLNVEYDSYGNVTALKDPTGEAQSFFYTYDTGVDANNQFYSDDFYGDAYNSLFLAAFMGWLPDLEPKNKRITSRVLTGDYELYSSDLTNHVFDTNGNLVSYKVFDAITYYNTWNCNSKTNHSKGPN